MTPEAKIIPPMIRAIMIDFATPIIFMVCGVQNGKMMIINPMDAKLAINKFIAE